MNISKLCIKRPVATIMLMLMVVVVGISSMIGIPQDLLPKIEFPYAIVMTNYSNASPEEVESMITKPIEQALASVEGLDGFFSMTMPGSSIVMIQFQMETDMNFATLDMREKISLISDYLPEEASEPMVLKMDMGAMPIVQTYVSGNLPLAELNAQVKDNVVPYFERIEGVASVSVIGGMEKQVDMELNQEKLNGYGISLSQISQILSAENINMPSGDISKGSTEVLVRTIGEFESIDDIANLPIALGDGSIVRLCDIAQISEDYQEQKTISRIDGKTAVGIMITKQSDANTVNVSNNVQKEIKKVQERFPDMNFVVGFDQADFIKKSISSVSQAALSGALLAVLVVFLFLKNIRSTLVIALSIPTSLLATFIVMDYRGMTLNLVTLCALTISVGMLVDNSIVMLENIFRLRQKIPNAEEAAEKGSKEILLAIVASTLTTVLVFLPIALSSGITALMFKDFCLTIVIALMASLVVSLTVAPMLCSRLLTQGLSTEYMRFGEKRYKFRYLNKFTKLIEYATERYDYYVRICLKKRKKVIIACILIFVVSISLVAMVGTELLPAADEGSFTVSVNMPYGTSLSDKDKFISGIEEHIMALPEISHCTVDIGSTNMMSTDSNASSLSVTLVDQKERDASTAQVIKALEKYTNTLTGADISVKETSSISAMMGSTDMSLQLKGKELPVLEGIGNDLITPISAIEGVVSADLDITEGNPELKVTLDRSKASYYGITAYNLANGLSSSLSGTTATKLKVNGDEIDVNLSLSDNYSDSIDNMKQIMISGATGMKVPVGQIATFEYDNSPNVINRVNQQRYVTLNIDIDSNNLSAVAGQINKLIESYTFPDGYYFESTGMQEEMMSAFTSLSKALLVSIALVYLLLAAQFESLRLPFIVLMSIPFAMSGAFFAMFITGTALSMTSFLGLIMLVGIVVNNAILLVEFITQNRDEMGREEALVYAGKLRLRPILMTTATTCVGMIPLSLGIGEGGEILAPMGISIIGGLIASTIVTLFLIPVLYSVFDDKKNIRLHKKEFKHAKVAALEEHWKEEDTQNVQS